MIATLDRASLEQFQTELIEAGFKPDAGDPRRWLGPIPESLREFTSAATITIGFVDGWPFQHPRLYVDRLDERHVSASGEICLWRPGDASAEWLTLDGYRKRIDEWARRAREGFHPEDFALDAHLSFGRIRPGVIATVELGKLGLEGQRGHRDVLSGTWKKNRPVLEIISGRKGAIEGRWYYVGDVASPPRDLEGVGDLLGTAQRKNFDRRLNNVSKDGEARIFLIAWDRELGREALVLLSERHEEQVVTEAIEVAPTDVDVLKLRAGPDQQALGQKRVVVFGVGAVGSQVALLLAQSGLSKVLVVDGGRLRPGDIVRHAANSWSVGDTKASAVRIHAYAKAPWTLVREFDETWDPDVIHAVVEEADLVIETTGLSSFTNMLSLICEREDVALVSAALYRGGSVGRVRRQAQTDTAIHDRAEDQRYPPIPPGDEPLSFEPGCSAPVNNASPVTVASIAALAAAVAIDVLTGRFNHDDEFIEVFRPLADAPFDRVGRLNGERRWRAWLSEDAIAMIQRAAAAAHPRETGGVLVGVLASRRPWVTRAVEVSSRKSSRTSYELPVGQRRRTVETLRRHEQRLGYLGEWHSHPSDIEPSSTDLETMTRLSTDPTACCPRPLLIVARRAGEVYELDARQFHHGALRSIRLITSGPLPAPAVSPLRPTKPTRRLWSTLRGEGR